MKRKTFYTNVDVDVDYDIEFGDLLDLVESCDENEMQQIRRIVGIDEHGSLAADNLYDEMKLEVLIEAYKNIL